MTLPKIEEVALHSICPEIMAEGGHVLDVGCLGFEFSSEMMRRGFRVSAIDPDPSISLTIVDDQIQFGRVALVGLGQGGMQQLARFGNGQGNHLVLPNTQAPRDAEIVYTTSMDISELMSAFFVGWWECVKLNCEGAEYDILLSWPGPISKQISVSFHEHTGANPYRPTSAYYEKMLAHLGRWYIPVRHEIDERYCAGPNYWSSVFVLKELCE